MLSVREKIAYGVGDTASNIVFQSVMLFLSFFYTDIFGISPAVVGTLFLVVRIFDAVTDPLMGSIIDNTQTRHGKFRPYLLWLAIPFGLISVLAFTTPDLPESGKVIYAFATYTLLMIAYTAINIPYSALGGVLTADPRERVSVQSYRFVFGMLGGLLVTACTIPMVNWLGQGDDAQGYQLTIAAMSALGVILFFLCFAGTKERISPPKDQINTLKGSLATLWKNDQWRVLSTAALFALIGMVMRGTLAIYYVKYYLQRPADITLFITIGMIGNIIGCALAQPLSKRFCKVKAYIVIQVVAAVLCIASYFVGPSQFILALAIYFIWGLILQMGTPLLWSKMADIVDYGHWLSGIRITGMVYSSIVFFIKMGVALGGAFASWLLAYYGYQANTELTEETQQGILISFTLLPSIAFVLVALVMRRYTLNDARVEKINRELKLSNS